jgi:hypothetical protein
VDSISKFLSAYADPYYSAVIEEDEKTLFTHKGGVMVIKGALGHTTDLLVDGVPAVDASAGCEKWLEVNGDPAKGCWGKILCIERGLGWGKSLWCIRGLQKGLGYLAEFAPLNTKLRHHHIIMVLSAIELAASFYRGIVNPSV